MLLLGFFSGLLGLFANVPYILDAIRGTTTPHLVSWSIFLLINLINIANQMASGATHSLWLTIGFCVSQAVIVCLAFRNGIGKLETLDVVCLVGACVGILLWMYFQTPIVSIIANIVAATIALIPTLVKAYRKPRTETKISWLLGGIAALLGAFAVGGWMLELLLFPLYSCLVQFLVYAILLTREKPIIWSKWPGLALRRNQV